MKLNYKKIIATTLTLLLLFNCIPSALALEWNGSSSGSGGGGTASNGYAVNTDGKSLVGFRFSLVDASSNPLGNSVDVFTSSAYSSYDKISSARRLFDKRSKADWVKQYSAVRSIATTTDTTNCYLQGDVGFETLLPAITSRDDVNALATALNTWQKNRNNIDALLAKIGAPGITKIERLSGEKIIIEPIISCRLAGNVLHTLTVTELAVYGGGYVFNENWDSNGGSSGNQNSWGWISEFTNQHFPNYMYTPTADCNWSAASNLSSQATFRTIITSGYGANVLGSASMGILDNTIDHWAVGFTNGEGNNSSKNAFLLVSTNIRATAGNTYTLDENRNTSPNGFQVRSSFFTPSISGSWEWYSMPYTVTQKASAMTYEYHYDPITYNITYDLAGGTNHADNPSTYNVLYGVTLKAPTKANCAFVGWKMNGEFVTGINPGATATFTSSDDLYHQLALRTTGNVTLTAVWEDPTYLISYDANGGEGAPAATPKAADIPAVLSDIIPTRAGYMFTGWNTKANGTGTTYLPSATYSGNANLTLYAQWVNADSIAFKGLGRTTIRVGDTFAPLEHLDAFGIPDWESCIALVDVIYNGVPRDADNKATTVGTGYTVVYNMAFTDGTTGQYRLVVTVLDENAETTAYKGYVRFISSEHVDTLGENSKWRSGELKERLKSLLAIADPTDEDAVEVWHLSSDDVRAIKDWVNESKTNGKTRSEQNSEFGSMFGYCQTKGKYADNRQRDNNTRTAELENTVAFIEKRKNEPTTV